MAIDPMLWSLAATTAIPPVIGLLHAALNRRRNQAMTNKFTASTKRAWLHRRKHFAHFIHRDQMKVRAGLRKASFIIPTPVLPIDSTGNATVQCPMDDNDTYGICGPAMCEHMYNIWTYGQGAAGFTEQQDNVSALLKQYLQVSGGDNGTDENMLVGQNGIWLTGLANNPQNVVTESLDFDVTDTSLTQYLIDQFYSVAMAWSVPDDFLQGFDQGSVWPSADTPDPSNGHYTPLADIGGPGDFSGTQSLDGFYRLWTWGTWCWVSPAFVASVQPQCFVAFSPRQFSLTTGLDSKGRHITAQAYKWVQIGGAAIPASVISAFPPATPIPPTPVPPVPPAPPSPPSPTPPVPASGTILTPGIYYTPAGSSMSIGATGTITVK